MHYFKLGAIALATSFAALASQTAAAAETLRLATVWPKTTRCTWPW